MSVLVGMRNIACLLIILSTVHGEDLWPKLPAKKLWPAALPSDPANLVGYAPDFVAVSQTRSLGAGSLEATSGLFSDQPKKSSVFISLAAVADEIDGEMEYGPGSSGASTGTNNIIFAAGKGTVCIDYKTGIVTVTGCTLDEGAVAFWNAVGALRAEELRQRVNGVTQAMSVELQLEAWEQYEARAAEDLIAGYKREDALRTRVGSIELIAQRWKYGVAWEQEPLIYRK